MQGAIPEPPHSACPTPPRYTKIGKGAVSPPDPHAVFDGAVPYMAFSSISF